MEETCGTELEGVWWPGNIGEIEKRTALARLRSLNSNLETGNPVALTEFARIAAAADKLDLAVKASSLALESGSKDADTVSLAVAALLARSLRTGAVRDLLDSAEIAAGHEADPALRCNRLKIYLGIGLVQSVEVLGAACPCKNVSSLSSTVGARRHGSADLLPPGEFAAVVNLVEGGRMAEARARIHSESQAWRVFLEREALAKWLAVLLQPAKRETIEGRLRTLAHLYLEGSANPQPLKTIEHFFSLPEPEVKRVAPALRQWIEGMQLVASYRVEEAELLLVKARPALRASGSPLSSSLDLALAALQYHLGDARGMGENALAARRKFDCSELPWACARALWLEAVALQAEADWESSVDRADEAFVLFSRLGEAANAGYIDTVRGVAFESMGSEREAESAYLASTKRLAETRDTRLLAGALSLFSRQQKRAGRAKLAVELQRESLYLDYLEGTPNLVAESTALFAEQLVAAGHYEEAQVAIAQAHTLIETIPSQALRHRALAILSQVEAELVLRESPKDAIKLLTHFLQQFASFGERHFRAEVLLARSKAYSRLGVPEYARQDLVNALSEVASQSVKLSDRVRSVTLLDRARDALEELVAVSLEIDPTGATALEWIERLRSEQASRGLGVPEEVLYSDAEIAEDVCATEYFALSSELLSWTNCGGRLSEVRRTFIERSQLISALDAFRAACRAGRKLEIAKTSSVVSAWLVVPQEKFIRGSVSWIVIPDSVFPPIPYSWLSSNGRYLFEDREVSVGTSLGDLRSQAVTRTAWRALAFGDPEVSAGATPVLPKLPYAEEEARHLATQFTGSIVKTGRSATWSEVTRAATSEFNLLHIAAHVTAGSMVPLSARLHLAPEAQRPTGRVSADEVARQRFQAIDLVVLASCSSSADRATRIAGTLDFSRAFLLAGADYVVGTLWDVSDREIAAVLNDFYNHLRTQGTPGDALRELWKESMKADLSPNSLTTMISLQMTTAHARTREEG